MSGETEDSVSGWTTDTLHAHIEGIIPLLRNINTAELAVRDQRISSELAIRDERLGAMDKANTVLDRTVHQMPTDLQVAIGNLDALTTMRMNAIEQVAALNAQQFVSKFAEFDARLIRDLAANSLQVAAAFAASEKLSIALDAANKEAIAKSEASTAANAAAQGATITDVKDRLTRLEGQKSGGIANMAQVLAIISSVIAFVAVAYAILKP